MCIRDRYWLFNYIGIVAYLLVNLLVILIDPYGRSIVDYITHTRTISAYDAGAPVKKKIAKKNEVEEVKEVVKPQPAAAPAPVVQDVRDGVYTVSYTHLYGDLVRRVDIKTSDFKAMKKTLEEIMNRKTTSFEEDSQLYHDAFYFAGKLLEYGERFKLSTTDKLKAWTGVDMVQYYN